MSQEYVKEEKKGEKEKEEKEGEKVTYVGEKPLIPPPPPKKIAFEKILRFRKVKAFLPIQPPKLELRKSLVFKLTIKPSKNKVSRLIQPPYVTLKRVLKIKIPISNFFSVHSEKVTPTIVSLIPPIQMRMPPIRLFQVKPSDLIQQPRLKSQLTITPRPRAILSKPIKIQAMSPILPQTLKTKIPVIYKLEVSKETVTIESSETKPREEEAGLGLLHLLFKKENRKLNINNALRASPERPILIVAEKTKGEEYLETLKHICKEIYRIKAGGLPKPSVIAVDKRRAEEDADAGKHITVIDDAKGEFFEFFGVSKDKEFEKDINLQKFNERIGELFAQPFGFLILHVADERMGKVITILQSNQHLIPKLCIVELNKLALDEKRVLARASWGFIELEFMQETSLDKYFLLGEKKFYNVLENFVNNPKYSWVRESAEDEEGSGIESFLHYSIKTFVIRCLEEELKKELGKKEISEKELTAKVSTEIQLKINGRAVVPDIYVLPNRVIEIETLYGTGAATWRKLRRTVEKYEGSNYSIQIVLPNLQSMLYLRGIKRLQMEFKDNGLSVEFYTLDIRNKRLVLIDEISKLYRQKKANIVFDNRPLESLERRYHD